MTDIPHPDRFSLPCAIADAAAIPPTGEGPLPAERMGTADWTVFTPERQGAFLECLADAGAVRLACRAAGVSPQTAYRARRRSAGFARAWDAACVAARPVAEDRLASRALDGVEEAVFYHGEEVARRVRFDARLLLAHLARLDRKAAECEVAAALPLLDEQIAALRRGEALPEPAPEPAPQTEGGKHRQDSVPGVPSSSAEEADDPCPKCGGRCTGPEEALTQADCMWLGNRLDRMDEARPEGALPPFRLGGSLIDSDDIEMHQLEAFEAGEAEWWLSLPPESGAGD